MSEREPATEQDAAARAAADLEALQKRFGEPGPRDPLPGQPALDLEGVPAYTPSAPRPGRQRRGRRGG